MWGNLLKIALGLAAVGLAAYGTYKIYKKITAKDIRDAVREKCPKAFSAVIKEKKQNAVKVGIFDWADEQIGEMVVKSDEGVDANLREGLKLRI